MVNEAVMVGRGGAARGHRTRGVSAANRAVRADVAPGDD